MDQQFWLGIAGSLIGAAVTGAIWYGALKGWMARREEREAMVKADVEDHEQRIRQLERTPRQPLDYAR